MRRMPSIQAAGYFGQEVGRHLQRLLRIFLGAQSDKPPLYLRPLGGDLAQTGFQFFWGEMPPNAEVKGPLTLLVEVANCSGKRDGLRLSNGCLAAAAGFDRQLVEQLAWASEKAFDVGPDEGLDGIASDRLPIATSLYGAALD